MGTIFDVVSSNLTVVCFEIKLFSLLPQIYSGSFIDFFIHYFHFLDDVFHKWLADFNFEPFYKLINEKSPAYLFKLIPENNAHYITRTIRKIKISFFESCFASTVMMSWNNLDANTRESASCNVF